MKPLITLMGLLALAAAAHAAPYENGTKHTPGDRMPPGDYECSQGIYKFKPCRVFVQDEQYFIEVKEGGRLQFMGQLLPTDEKNQLILRGELQNPGELCPTCPDEQVGTECAGSVAEKATCAAQPVMANLRKQGKQWSGDLIYYLVRGVDGRADKGWYRLGITEKFKVRPARKKK
ncbi:MAG: hypothetical protein KC613_14210 [Myxococcales bacterium]|nr:hypothetical protein [Myxococcales bacterium]MCB9522895.1 hypothetical protein [Myxococcales bacterium]